MNDLPDIIDLPRDLLYDLERHLWVRQMAGSNELQVGIDTVGLRQIGDLAYVQCAAAGASVKRGAPLGSLEAAKMTDTLFAPVSGRITAVNEAAMRNPSLVNRDPYGEGWLVAIIPNRWNEEKMALTPGARIDPAYSAGLEPAIARGVVRE